MAVSYFKQFLYEATIPDPDCEQPLGQDCLYGLHTSWCLIQGRTPRSSLRFNIAMRCDAMRCDAMRRCGEGPGGRPRKMRGPAADTFWPATRLPRSNRAGGGRLG